MGKLIITTNISLDGVTQDPTGEEGFGLGGWFQEFGGKDLRAVGQGREQGRPWPPRPCCWAARATSGSLRGRRAETIGEGLAFVTYEVARAV